MKQLILKRLFLLDMDGTIYLDNVNQRIKIIYGKDYGCTISSGDGMTIVTIKIPKKS